MAHTDNTVPYRLWRDYGLHYDSPLRCYLTYHHSRTKEWRKISHRHGRREAARALRLGIEPEPYRPRNSVLWDVL